MEIKHDIFPSERIIAYSDAIFVIALTLLVLEIKIPESGPTEKNDLFRSLLLNWPSYISFLISFLIISVIWFNHHTMFHYIRYVNHPLMLINTLLMLNVVVIPFCATLLGRYAAEGNRNSMIASLVYGSWITLGGIPFNWLWGYALKHDNLLAEGIMKKELFNIKRHFIRGPFLYLQCTLLALINSWASICGFTVLIILYFLPASLWAKKSMHYIDEGVGNRL
jgi:uncharacterized membrane protein